MPVRKVLLLGGGQFVVVVGEAHSKEQDVALPEFELGFRDDGLDVGEFDGSCLKRRTANVILLSPGIPVN